MGKDHDLDWPWTHNLCSAPQRSELAKKSYHLHLLAVTWEALQNAIKWDRLTRCLIQNAAKAYKNITFEEGKMGWEWKAESEETSR